MIAVDSRTAVTFSHSPGQTGRDRHGHELAGASPAITLKGGNMQAKAGKIL